MTSNFTFTKFPLLALFYLLLAAPLVAQTTADFENFELPVDTFLNGAGGELSYESGNLELFVNYSFFPGFGEVWNGWAISNVVDTVTRGFTNQYASITGGGANNSEQYAVYSNFNGGVMHLRNDAVGDPVNSLYITNNTYAYYSMLEGDNFAKIFGGETGDDPDYFLLTIKAYLNGELSTDSVDFYLADYRFEDNSMDYIVDEWTLVDLSSLGGADSLFFSLSSTDNDLMAGMNTPAYFCIDDVVTSDAVVSTTNLAAELGLAIYPNPVADQLNLTAVADLNNLPFQVFDQMGRQVKAGVISSNQSIPTATLAPGQYHLRLVLATGTAVTSFLKR